MEDFLVVGAIIAAKEYDRTETQKHLEIERNELAKYRLRQAWNNLLGPYANSINKALDNAKLNFEIYGEEIKNCSVTLKRKSKSVNIDLLFNETRDPEWKIEGETYWKKRKPDILAFCIWRSIYAEYEQREAINQLRIDHQQI